MGLKIVTGRTGTPHVSSNQIQAFNRSLLGDLAILDLGQHFDAVVRDANTIRIYDGCIVVQGIYAVIPHDEYEDVLVEPVSVGNTRIDTIYLHYAKDMETDTETVELDIAQGEEAVNNPVKPDIDAGGDTWEGTTDIRIPLYDVTVTSFETTIVPYEYMNVYSPTISELQERIPETTVSGVKGDAESEYRSGNVNITPTNIGLGNVDNTADTDKPVSNATQTALNLKADLTYVDAKIAAAYHAGGSKTVAELVSALLIADNMGKVYNMSDSGVTTADFVEGAGDPINEGDNVGICNVGTEESPIYKFDLLSGFVDLSAYATTSAVNAGLAEKVDKVAGKGLSTEDFTTAEKNKLVGISSGATQTIANPQDTPTDTLNSIAIDGVIYDVEGGGGSGDVEKKLYDNGTELVSWTVSGGAKNSDNISLNVGGGTFKNGAYTTNPIDVTKYTKLKVKYMHNGTTDEKEVDISAYTGNKYISFYYLTDSWHNECGIYLSETAGTFASGIILSSATSASSNCVLYEMSILKNGTKLSDLSDVDISDAEDGDIMRYNGNEWKNSNALQGTITATGNPLTIESSESNLVECTAEVEPVQDLHGYDHPWVGGAGKNKLPMTVEGIKSANTSGTWSGNNYTLNGITFTIQTDSNNNVIGIKINGTKNGDSAIFNLANYTASSGDKLNGCNDTTSNTYYIYARGGSSVCRNSDVTISNNDVGVARLYAIAVINNTAISNAIVYPMIRLATETDPTFAPYTNISPITGQTEVVLEDMGKNLLKFKSLTPSINNGITFSPQKDGTIILSGTLNDSGASTRFELDISDGLYVYNDDFYETNETSYTQIIVDSSWKNPPYSKTDISVEVSNNTVQIYIATKTSHTTPTMLKPMLRFSTETTFLYEPYKGKTYTIQLGDTIYGGELDVVTGELTVTHGYIESYNSEPLPSTWISDRDEYSEGATPTIGAQVVYELAEPYIIKLTPQQIRLLKGTNNISCNTGDLSIKYYPDNVLGQLKGDIEKGLNAYYDYQIQALWDKIGELQA